MNGKDDKLKEDSRSAPFYDWSKFTLSEYSADEARLAALFYTLDSHKDGFVTVEELEHYFLNKGEVVDREEIEAIIARGDIKLDGKLDYQEFMLFMLEHERNLWIHFVDLDKDGSGEVSHTELLQYCKEMELKIPPEKLSELIKRLDKDGNLKISWDEFREFNQFKLSYSISNNSLYYFGSAYVDSILALEIPSTRQDVALSKTKKLVCGGLAGVVSRTVTAPFDRLKVLLQVQGQQKVLGASQNLSILQMFKAMRREGFITMWRGNAINCCKIFPENAMRFYLFEHLCESGRLDLFTHDFLNKLTNGAVTGMIIQTGMYPLELTKTRVMTSPIRITMKQSCVQIWNEGSSTILTRWSNFYKGFKPAIIGVMPFAALELGISKKGTEMYNQYIGTRKVGYWPLFLIASTATFTAMGCTYPFRLLTCQMQAYTGPEEHRLGFKALSKKIWKAERTRGFYRGFFANGIKAIPASAVGWTVFNMSQNYWDSYVTERTRSYS